MADGLDKTMAEIKNLKTANRPIRHPVPPPSSIPDLSGNWEERLKAVQEGVNQKIRGQMKGHYGFNPENS